MNEVEQQLNSKRISIHKCNGFLSNDEKLQSIRKSIATPTILT